MPKNPKPEQQMTTSGLDDEQDTGAIRALMDAIPRSTLGPFETRAGDETPIPEGGSAFSVQILNGGPDAFTIRESTVTASGFGAVAYRTVQRMDLATRLQLPADYDPADLVGRTFLVPA